VLMCVVPFECVQLYEAALLEIKVSGETQFSLWQHQIFIFTYVRSKRVKWQKERWESKFLDRV